MRNIKRFDKEYSIEEYIKIEILSNRGTQCMAFSEDLRYLCEKANIPVTGKETKEAMYDKLISNGYTPKMLAEEFGVGVSSQVYQQEFNITHKDVKRLEKSGKIRKVGEYRFRAYGKYLYAPLYDAYQFASMTENEMQDMLEKRTVRTKSGSR